MPKFCIEANLASSFLNTRVSAVLLASSLVSEWCCSVRMQKHYSSRKSTVHVKAKVTPCPVISLYLHLFQLHFNGDLLYEYCFLTVGLLSWQASLFGAQDGQGLSLVYYFTLPEGWEPKDVGNEAALGMLQRFIHDGREQDKYINILSTLMTCCTPRVLHVR